MATKTVEPKYLTAEQRWEYAEKYRNVFKLQNSIGFGDMNIETPEIEFYQDGSCYTDHKMIHIGVGTGTFDLFECGNEEDFYNAAEYLRGHEEQHCRSTAKDPYANGIRIGMESIIDYIALQVEKKPKRFPSWRHYAAYVDGELPTKGIYISINMLGQIVAGIQNSLEDGRIERLRSNKFPGFERIRCYYRAKFWLHDSPKWEPYTTLNDVSKLDVITNCILSLATCQLYPYGFIETYGTTPLKNEVDALMPYIGKAIMAGRTRDMAMQSVNICKAIAPYIFAACKISQKDMAARKALEDLIAKIIKGIVDSMPEGELSERNEEQDDGSINSTFEHSDLTITLDDETYDKLVKNSKQGNGNSGIMIRREHPKEDENNNDSNGENGQNQENKERQSDTNGGNSSSNSSSNGKSQKASDDETQKTAKRRSSEANRETQADESASKESSSKQPSGQAQGSQQTENAASESDADSKSGTEPSNTACANSAQDSSEPSGSNASKKNGLDAKAKVTKEELENARKSLIEKEIEKAGEEISAEAREAVTDVNQQATVESRRAASRKKSATLPDTPVTSEEMKDICDFVEERRKYRVTDKEPIDLAMRGRTLNRKNKMYFKPLSTPNVSYLDEGSIDPSRLYGLAMKETDVFRRKGTDKVFDGCAYILIDNSGSMAGNKRKAACRAAAIIEDGFDGIMPLKIVAFNSQYTIIHEVVKDWTERLPQNGCWNFCIHGPSGCGNEDGYDIQIATRELMKRPEHKKLLCVLSDGTPGSTGLCRKAIDNARKQGITVCGIYFEQGAIGRDADTFKKMYQKDYICCTDKEIDGNLTKIFRRFATSR